MARGSLGMDEILESVGMVGRDHLDIRTVTLGDRPARLSDAGGPRAAV